MASNVSIQMEENISAVNETSGDIHLLESDTLELQICKQPTPEDQDLLTDVYIGAGEEEATNSDDEMLVPEVRVEQPGIEVINEEEEDSSAVNEDILLPSEQVDFDEVTMRYYLTPYLLFIENQERILSDKHEHLVNRSDRNKLASDQQISIEVSIIVQELCEYLTEESDALFRGGELKRCGSVEEGTKVSSCDEFDFQYLVSLDNYKATRKPLLRTKPRSSGETTKSFFSLAVEEINDTDETIHTELLAKDVHTLFKEEVGNGLSRQDLEYGHLLKKAGPAVKIVLWRKTESGKPKCFVKIDLTLGIRAVVDKLFDKEELTSLALSLPGDLTLKCHFVCAHDYWKISFVETEQELMKKICEEDVFKMACYRAIKCVRDKVDIKDPYGDGILPSYPIKMTFMDIALKDCQDHVQWKMEDLGKHVIHVLKEVESRGQGHQLKCPFLLGDDVMAEADRSYLESRRILKELKRSEGVYISQQSVLVPVLIASSFVYFYLLLSAYTSLEDGSRMPRSANNLTIRPYVYACYFTGRYSMIVLGCQLGVCLLAFLTKKGHREIHPLHKIYSIVTVGETFFFCIGFCVEMTFLFSGTWQYEPTILPDGVIVSPCGSNATGLLYGALIQITISVPMLISGLIISANAIFSIALGKNLRLFHTFLTFPSRLGSWRWRAPDGNLYEFLPEVCGREGLQGFAKARAIIVAILTPIAVFLTIVTPIFYMTADSYTDFPRIRYACIVQIICVIIVDSLLMQQVAVSPALWHHRSRICESRIMSCATSAFCYFFPYTLCPDWKVLKDDLRTRT